MASKPAETLIKLCGLSGCAGAVMTGRGFGQLGKMNRFRFSRNGRPLRIATAFVLQMAGVGFAFLFNILLARLLGVSNVGIYILAITIVDIGATISRLGLESASLRFGSVAYSQKDRATLAGLYRRSMGLVFAASIAVALPVWLIVSQLSLGGDRAPELRAELPLLALAIAPVALLIIQAEFLKAIGESGEGTFAQTVVPPLLRLAGLVLLWFLGTASLHAAIAIYLIVVFVAAIYAIIRWNQRLPGIWREPGSFDTRRLLATSLPLLLVTSMYLVMGWTDILVLGIWVDAREIGIYGVAVRIALLAPFVLGAINVVVAPQFAALYSEGDTVALKRLARQSSFWTIVVATPAILVLLIAPELVLQLFGPQFKEGALSLRILALGQFVNLATGCVGTLLLMTGHEKVMRNNVSASAALNLIGTLILVPHYGAVGAATSTAISLAFMNIVSWTMVRRKLHINVLAYKP